MSVRWFIKGLEPGVLESQLSAKFLPISQLSAKFLAISQPTVNFNTSQLLFFPKPYILFVPFFFQKISKEYIKF